MSDKPREIKSLGEYQRSMDRFERCDGFILPEMHLIIRIDAHRTGPEWSDFPDEGYPFDPGFVTALTGTAKHLMGFGFRVLFAFVHGDEISVLLDPQESTNQRRRGRLVSLFSSAGAVGFLREYHRPVIFHAQLSELPTTGHVIDYFLWQRKVASRNFFSRTLGIRLAALGLSSTEIDAKIGKISEQERESIALEVGLTAEDITRYHRYGLALWWDHSTGEPQVVVCDELPTTDEEYRDLIAERITAPSHLPDELQMAAMPIRRVQLEPKPIIAQEPGRVQPQRTETRSKEQATPRPAPKPGVPKEAFRLGFRGSKGS